MYLKKIYDQNSKAFKVAWNIYEESFPKDEKRSLKDQIKLFNNQSYEFLTIIKEDELIGLLLRWDLGKFLFIEHFAILKKLRNKRIGETILKEYVSSVKKSIILEVDKPENSIAKRRIGFYERLGFCLNHFDGYVQPPYEVGKESVPMFLMTFPEKANEFDFQTIKSQIHKVVYGVKG